jgi:threonine/homoserine/homoserine lactone efflux protein
MQAFLFSFMEKKYICITELNPTLILQFVHFKNQLMTSQNESAYWRTRTFLNRLIILGFMVLVGYSLAKSIYSQSVMGIILALISLGAGIYFLYLLAKVKEESRKKETA